MKYLLTTILILGAAIAAAAQPGRLDTSFGTNGQVTTAVGDSDFAEATSAAIQHDGKIVVAGIALASSRAHFALVRYNVDGTLDTTFGTGGKVIAEFSGRAQSVVIQDDGKIVAAGYSYRGTSPDFAVIRLNSDGTLDMGFGVGGIVETDVSGSTDAPMSVAIKTNGKIVAAGYSYVEPRFRPSMVQYTADGIIDTSFGIGGKMILETGSSSNSTIESMAIQADGKIVLAGTGYFDGSGDDFVTVRCNSDGSQDAGFGINGVVRTDFQYDASGKSVAIQADGKIVVGGDISDPAALHIMIVRYLSNGSLDPEFGSGGKITDFRDWEACHSIALQADGAILAAGWGASGTLLARYKSDGSVDSGYGRGLVDFAYGDTDIASAVAIDSAGRAVIAGHSAICPWDCESSRIAVARFLTAVAVSVSGRVLRPDGRGLRNAKVVITDSHGNARSVMTNSFGFYQFDNVTVGESDMIGVVSKQYRFQSRPVNVTDTLTDVDFVGLE